MIENLPELFRTRAGFTDRFFFNPKMKMRVHTKLKTIDEIPLDDLESQIRVQG